MLDLLKVFEVSVCLSQLVFWWFLVDVWSQVHTGLIVEETTGLKKLIITGYNYAWYHIAL